MGKKYTARNILDLLWDVFVCVWKHYHVNIVLVSWISSLNGVNLYESETFQDITFLIKFCSCCAMLLYASFQ